MAPAPETRGRGRYVVSAARTQAHLEPPVALLLDDGRDVRLPGGADQVDQVIGVAWFQVGLVQVGPREVGPHEVGARFDPHPFEHDADDLIDLVRTAREADVAAVVKQQRDGRFKVSLRSRGGHDVAAAAARFGGGGHRLASGYTSSQGLVDTVESLKDALGAETRPGPSAA